MFVDLCITAIEFFAAPVAGDVFAAPAKGNELARRTTGDSFGLFELMGAIGLGIEFLAANRADSQNFLGFAAGSLASIRAKEDAAFASLDLIGIFLDCFAAVSAGD